MADAMLRGAAPRIASMACLVGLVLRAALASAARPLVTDDARIVEPHACQLETWTLLSRDGHEVWFLPACNPLGFVELTAGFGLLPADERTPTEPIVVVQGKTVVRPVEPGSWGWGFALGGRMRGARGGADEELLDRFYAYVPATASLFSERLFVHANAGLAYEAEPDELQGTWGVAIEALLPWSAFALVEVYGAGEHVFTQAGLRVWLLPDRVQLDAVYGVELGSSIEGSWVSVGMRLLSPPLWR